MPLSTVGELLLQYKYAIMVPLALFLQPFVGMTAGLLARLGYMDVWVVWAVLLFTALAGDVGWYWVGYHWGEGFARRFGRFVSITSEHVEGVKKIFHKYHAPILLISKVTNGFGLAIVTLFTAGLTRVPFWRYMVLNLIGESIWAGMIVSVGYFFGEAYLRVHDIFGRVTLVALFAIVLIVVLGFGRYLRWRIERAAVHENNL